MKRAHPIERRRPTGNGPPTLMGRTLSILVTSDKDLREVSHFLRQTWDLRRRGLHPSLPTNIHVVCKSVDHWLRGECSAQIAAWAAPVASVAVRLRLRLTPANPGQPALARKKVVR